MIEGEGGLDSVQQAVLTPVTQVASTAKKQSKLLKSAVSIGLVHHGPPTDYHSAVQDFEVTPQNLAMTIQNDQQ